MADRDNKRRPAGALEAEIVAALWAAGDPLTPKQVQAELGGKLAYTTVMTALTRLYEKDVVSREKRGRAYAYTAVLDSPGIAAARMRELLEAGGDREAVLARFLGALSDADERTLVELLRAASADGRR
jgi:predicted transcriptional regulator